MTEVKGTLELVKVGGKQEGALMKRDTLTFGSVDHLRKIQETLHVVNELVREDCYVAVTVPRMSVKKDDDIHNWKFEATAEEMLHARDRGLNNYVLHKTIDQLERMTDPMDDMSYDEKLCLLHCVIVDMILSPDSDMEYNDAFVYEGRLAYAEKLAIELHKSEFLTTLSEMACDFNYGGCRVSGIFECPVELGGLKGMKDVHKQSMRFYDKSRAFKLEASTQLKCGRKIFDDIREQYQITGREEMKI